MFLRRVLVFCFFLGLAFLISSLFTTRNQRFFPFHSLFLLLLFFFHFFLFFLLHLCVVIFFFNLKVLSF
jgi:hypothetical protein